MWRLIVLLLGLCLAQAGNALGAGPVCRVTVLGHSVGHPDDRLDGLVRMRVFVSTSTKCRSGYVELAVFPTSVCRSQPQTDVDNSNVMKFTYEPPLLKVAVKPGNIGSGVVEISSVEAGRCTFNAHVASCGTVVPTGVSCEPRDLTDPQPESPAGGVRRGFNWLR